MNLLLCIALAVGISSVGVAVIKLGEGGPFEFNRRDTKTFAWCVVILTAALWYLMLDIRN
jgi:hypothetical protein